MMNGVRDFIKLAPLI